MLTLTGPAADTTGDFNLNGIAATPDGRMLIVAHSTNEALYTVDPLTGASEPFVKDVAPERILYEVGRIWVAEPSPQPGHPATTESRLDRRGGIAAASHKL